MLAIVKNVMFVEPVGFPEQSFDAIALYGAFKVFFGHRHAGLYFYVSWKFSS